MATHCQRGTKEDVVAYIRSKGLAADVPNVTVSSMGGHPKVKGNGYVPYYMVFDHTGQLAHHHMCGAYHGGDGLKMIEWVDELLEKTPAIYLGDEPFESEAALAAKVAKKKGLRASLREIEKKLADGELDEGHRAELERLKAGISDYAVRMTTRAEELMATKPSETLPALKDLVKELKGTSIVEPVEVRLGELSKSKDLKTAIAVEKKLAKIVKGLEKRDPCKACDRKGHESLNAACSECKEEARSGIKKALKKLDALIEEAGELPIAATVRRYADTWR